MTRPQISCASFKKILDILLDDCIMLYSTYHHINCITYMNKLSISVADPERFDADPDPILLREGEQIFLQNFTYGHFFSSNS